MKPLPMPIRLAAGLVATALEEAQSLPRKLTELPVTAVSQALQASMRLQQRVTELAIKGDRALGSLRPVPETPTWARFDEDEEDPPPRSATNGLVYGNPPRIPPPVPPKVTPVRILPDPQDDEFDSERSEVPAPRTPAERTGKPALEAVADPGDEPTSASAATTSESTPDSTADSKAAATPTPGPDRKPEAESAAKPGAESAAKPGARSANGTGSRAKSKSTGSKSSGSKSTAKARSTAQPDSDAASKSESSDGTTGAGGPAGLAEYESWTLPQLRGRFRTLSLRQLEQLLEWETSHRDRPPYVTMLSNRITSVSGK